MSDPTPAKSNRTRLLIAIAVLIGTVILLVVTEFASVSDAPPAATGQSGEPDRSGGPASQADDAASVAPDR